MKKKGVHTHTKNTTSRTCPSTSSHFHQHWTLQQAKKTHIDTHRMTQEDQSQEFKETFADALKRLNEGEKRADELEKMLDSLEQHLDALLQEAEDIAQPQPSESQDPKK